MNEVNYIENDIDLTKQLFKKRIVAKTISQMSFELREIDKAFPSDYYEFSHAEKMLQLYEIIEDKVLELAEVIKEIRQEQI
jgi:hypothetical protein